MYTLYLHTPSNQKYIVETRGDGSFYGISGVVTYPTIKKVFELHQRIAIRKSDENYQWYRKEDMQYLMDTAGIEMKGGR